MSPRSGFRVGWAVFGLCIFGLAALLWPTAGKAAGADCGLTGAAFCDTFDQGPSAIRGRAGDLDPALWAVGRLAPSDFSGFGPVVNPVDVAPIPPCRASFPSTNVYPPNDTLICDPSGTRTSQLMTAVVIQNYGNNSYMIRQPFDFANRTGKIVFDVDAVSPNVLATFIAVDITEDPIPAPTFREYENFEPGPLPKNGLMMKWSNNCNSPSNAITLGEVLLYTNYVPTTLNPSFTVSGTGCPRTRLGSLNHFEIRLSQSLLEIYGSDYSTDNGQTFPNFRRIYAANLTMPFTRGYVHIAARNHASKKYGYGADGVYHWDNIAFDGPVISNPRSYEVRDNNTMNGGRMNLGYLLRDGTSGQPAGIYDPNNRLPSLQLQGVNVTGAVSAKLTLNVFFNAISHAANTTWGLSFRFNGGTWRNRPLTATEVQQLNTAGSAGNLSLALDVPVGDLQAGSNTLEILPVNAPMDLPPAVANIDLVLTATGGGGSPPAAPLNLRIVP